MSMYLDNSCKPTKYISSRPKLMYGIVPMMYGIRSLDIGLKLFFNFQFDHNVEIIVIYKISISIRWRQNDELLHQPNEM